MIKKTLLIDLRTRVKYLVDSKRPEKLTLPFCPDKSESANYKGFVITNLDEKLEVPIDVLTGIREFENEERDEYSKVLSCLEDYIDQDTDLLRIKKSITKLSEIKSKIIINDLTDQEINGYEVYDVTAKPIWLSNGKRKFEIVLKEKLDPQNVTFTVNNINSENRENINYTTDVFKSEKNLYFWLDTDVLKEKISICETQGVSTNAFINIKAGKVIIKYPLELKFIDLTLDNGIHSKDEVSIDFGTSSTCIAYSENKMLHFSDRVKNGSEEEYENMTSFIIYDWENFNSIWNSNNCNLPHLIKAKGGTGDELRKNNGQFFGDGSDVKLLMNSPDRGVLGASISDIKSLSLIKEEKKFRQFFNYNSSYDLKLGFKETSNLDPIEFYAYQIGRKLNSPIKGNVYTKYHLTTPVKFSSEAKERILSSFELGLKRSLPSSLKDFIDVRTKYNEPTALLGSLLLDHFPKSENPQFFSIFDFGGGTLDYIFGVKRPAIEEGSIYLEEEEEEEYKGVVELFNSGGSNECGGEKILKRMAYKVYLQNADILGSEVPILVPEGEEKDDRISSVLYDEDVKNRVNLELLVEKVAREILYTLKPGTSDGKKCWTSSILGKIEVTKNKSALKSSSINISSKLKNPSINTGKENKNYSTEIDFVYEKGISLQDLSSNEKNYQLKIDVRELIDLYINIIEENIKGFNKDLESVFNSERVQEIVKEYKLDKFDKGSFKIFLAGNSCKSPVVKPKIQEINEFFDIELVNSNRYSFKTAVAKGYKVLETEELLIKNWKESKKKGLETSEPLKYRVLSIDSNNVDDILSKNSKYNREYKRLIGLGTDSNTFTINYTESSKHLDRFDSEIRKKVVEIPQEVINKYVKGKGKQHIYVEAFGYDSIIYTFGKKKGVNEETLNDMKFLEEHCIVTL